MVGASFTRHVGLGGNRTTATPTTNADPVPETHLPPRVSLGTDRSEGAVVEALSVLDPLDRLGSDRNPVFLSLQSIAEPGQRFVYLGLTTASEQWLARVSPDSRFARDCRAGLRDAYRRGGVADIPDRPLHQIMAAARVLDRDGPAADLVLSLMPLGLGAGNGSGLAYSCDPVTGAPGMVGVFGGGRTGAQLLTSGGTDLVAAAAAAPWGARLAGVVHVAQEQAGRAVRVEFVVMDGELFVLRVGHHGFSGRALLRTVVALTRTNRLDMDAALATVTDADLADALVPVTDTGGLPVAARGLGVSSGVASGAAVFDAADAVAAARSGRPVVLVLPESRPEHLAGLLAAQAVVTERGGRTSHAAVVARGLRRPCVTALRTALVDVDGRCLRLADGGAVHAGTEITVNGQTGAIYLGAPEPAAGANSTGIDETVRWLLDHLPDGPGIEVRCNADGADAASDGRAAGATGVGLCRIEHMFLGQRQGLQACDARSSWRGR